VRPNNKHKPKSDLSFIKDLLDSDMVIKKRFDSHKFDEFYYIVIRLNQVVR